MLSQANNKNYYKTLWPQTNPLDFMKATEKSFIVFVPEDTFEEACADPGVKVIKLFFSAFGATVT